MSEENRPNLNAVGLMMDIFDAIMKRKRGQAENASELDMLLLFKENVLNFVEEIDAALDAKFPVVKKEETPSAIPLCVREISAPGWSGLTCDHSKAMHDPKTGKCFGYHQFGWGVHRCDCTGFIEEKEEK